MSGDMTVAAGDRDGAHLQTVLRRKLPQPRIHLPNIVG
jgi:hypothetical protein